MLFCPVHALFQVIQARCGSCGVVRIVEKQHLGPLGLINGDLGQVRKKAVFRTEGKDPRFASREDGPGVVNRVRGIGDDDEVAGFDKGQGNMCDAFLGPDERYDLAFRVERDAESSLEPLGRGRPVVPHARVGRILVIGRVFGRRFEAVDDMLRGGKIRVPIPRLMISTPFAATSAFNRSISANK